MSRLRLVDGAGVVGRNDSTIWWAADGELLEALGALSDRGFKGLAASILELDFAVGAVAVIDLESEFVFVFGDAQLTSGGVILDGSTTGTWIEQRLPDKSNFAVNAYISTVDDLTSLVEGTVRAGGFVMGSPELADEPPQPHAEVRPEPEPEPEPEPNDELANATLVIPGKSERTTDLAGHVVTEDRVAPSLASSEEPDQGPESDPASDAEVATMSESHATGEGPKLATVEFDDGRRLEVRGGLVVGRNPESGDIPSGFAAVTVLGEFVSRRHWELDLDLVAPQLRDLGSASGTIVEFAHRTKRLGPNETVGIEHSFRVLFADHWASITVKPG